MCVLITALEVLNIYSINDKIKQNKENWLKHMGDYRIPKKGNPV